jgi:hypothetical protein
MTTEKKLLLMKYFKGEGLPETPSKYPVAKNRFIEGSCLNTIGCDKSVW